MIASHIFLGLSVLALGIMSRTTSFIDTPIEFAKGIGPQKADVLKTELRIFTFGDLLFHFPYRYVDRTQFYTVADFNEEMQNA